MFTEKITRSPDPATHAQRERTWWLIPKPFDLVSSLLYLGVLLPFVYCFLTGSGYTPPRTWWQVAIVLLNTALLLGIDRLEFHIFGEKTPTKIAILLLLMRIVLIEVLCALDEFRYSPCLYLILLFLGCLYFGDIAGYALGLSVWVVYIVKHFYYNPVWLSSGNEQQYFFVFTVGCVFAITIARVVLREKASRDRAEDLLSKLSHSNEQLQAYAEKVAELATISERNRLAREIHDSLGHYLTVINVQLEKALAFRDKKPLEAERAVSDAKHLASEALQDVRRSVGALRATDELPALFPAIATLVERVQGERTTITLRMEGDESAYTSQGLQTLYRAAQEGLTNVQKHARATQIWLDLKLDKQEATLCLRDNGQGFDRTSLDRDKTEQGYGLKGLRERLELVTGSLKIESALGQGTILLVSLPGPEISEGKEVSNDK